MARHARTALVPQADSGAGNPMLFFHGGDWCEQLPTLVGSRVSLRELDLSDAPALVAHLSSMEVQRFIAPPPSSVESFENFILWAQSERARGRYACFAVVPHGMSQPIGVFQLRQVEGGFTTAEWGFALGSAFWGAGYFADAARMVVDFAVDTVGVCRLEARSAVDNRRGNGALRKLGAVQEGVLRRAFRKDDRVLDAALWTILSDEWRQLRGLWHSAIVH
jgi:[ribosomal protein S5]-alanine N-acetyltransferase